MLSSELDHSIAFNTLKTFLIMELDVIVLMDDSISKEIDR